jgi:hypothetical protein
MYFQSIAFPQRLKPGPICDFLGTAKAMPFQSREFFYRFYRIFFGPETQAWPRRTNRSGKSTA